MGFVLQVYWKRTLYQCSLHKKCPYLELFWSAFSGIRSECRKIRSISQYSIRMRENRTRITPNTDTFYAVVVVWDLSSFSDQWIKQLTIAKFSEDFNQSPLWKWNSWRDLRTTDTYSEPCQTSKTDFFAKIVNGWRWLWIHLWRSIEKYLRSDWFHKVYRPEYSGGHDYNVCSTSPCCLYC